MRFRRVGGQHRQRLRCWLPSAPDQPYESECVMKTLFWNVRESATRAALLKNDLLTTTSPQHPMGERCCATGVPDGVPRSGRGACRGGRALRERSREAGSARRVPYPCRSRSGGSWVHGRSDAFFNEVGNAAGIKNAPYLPLAIEAVAPDEIVCTSVQTGEGMVACAHGELAVPRRLRPPFLRGIPVLRFKLRGSAARQRPWRSSGTSRIVSRRKSAGSD